MNDAIAQQLLNELRNMTYSLDEIKKALQGIAQKAQ